MRQLALALLLFFGCTTQAAPRYKDQVCITPTNTMWSWYGLKGRVLFRAYSSEFKGEVYHIVVRGRLGAFDPTTIDQNTIEIPCDLKLEGE